MLVIAEPYDENRGKCDADDYAMDDEVHRYSFLRHWVSLQAPEGMYAMSNSAAQI